jgi:hypothetical protein
VAEIFNEMNGTNLSSCHVAAIASHALDKLFLMITERGGEIDDYTESR